MIPKIAPWKKTRVDELEELLNSDGVIGIVDVSGVPAKNMLDMRASLRTKLSITMAKKSLIRRAWKSFGQRPGNSGVALRIFNPTSHSPY